MISLGVSLAAMIGTGMIARSIPYEDTGKKHLAWALHVSISKIFVRNNLVPINWEINGIFEIPSKITQFIILYSYSVQF